MMLQYIIDNADTINDNDLINAAKELQGIICDDGNDGGLGKLVNIVTDTFNMGLQTAITEVVDLAAVKLCGPIAWVGTTATKIAASIQDIAGELQDDLMMDCYVMTADCISTNLYTQMTWDGNTSTKYWLKFGDAIKPDIEMAITLRYLAENIIKKVMEEYDISEFNAIEFAGATRDEVLTAIDEMILEIDIHMLQVEQFCEDNSFIVSVK